MDQTLVQALSGLKLADGHDDDHARMASLLALAEDTSLKPNEIRLLKDILLKRTLQTDILARLPVELAVVVLTHLEICDIWSCFTVSKTWRSKLVSEDVSRALADVHFPALSYISRRDLANRGSDSYVNNIATCFVKAVGESMRCREVPRRKPLEKKFAWSDEKYFSIDPEEYNRFPTPPPDHSGVPHKSLYAHGRIAWAYDEHTFVVDCLVTRKRRILDHPDGKLLESSIELSALGSKLLVAHARRYLYAWDVETGRCERARLQNQVRSCTTEGDRVVFVTGDTQVFVWKFGGSLLSVDVASLSPPLDIINARSPIAIAHPNDEAVVFLSTQKQTAHKQTKFVIYEFNQRKFVKSYQSEFLGSGTNYWAGFEKVNSYGLYALCYSNLGEQKRLTRCICTTQFDIYHKKFGEQRFDAPAFSPMTGYRAWNKCLVFGARNLQDEQSTILVHHPGYDIGRLAARGKVRWPEPGPNAFQAYIHDDTFEIALSLDGYLVWRLDSKPMEP
ncbi:hypothetical protein PG990_003878 [Apiospora arundinis]